MGGLKALVLKYPKLAGAALGAVSTYVTTHYGPTAGLFVGQFLVQLFK